VSGREALDQMVKKHNRGKCYLTAVTPNPPRFCATYFYHNTSPRTVELPNNSYNYTLFLYRSKSLNNIKYRICIKSI